MASVFPGPTFLVVVMQWTLLKALERFVCCLYGYAGYADVNKVRSDIFQSRYSAKSSKLSFSNQTGIDLSLLPPCKSSLRMHCLRVNFQSHVWKHSHEGYPSLVSPVGCGWKLDEEGKLAIHWIDGDVLPAQLVEVMTSNETDADNKITDEEEMIEQIVEGDDEVNNIIDIIFENDDE